jgi:hypothetical protein
VGGRPVLTPATADRRPFRRAAFFRGLFVCMSDSGRGNRLFGGKQTMGPLLLVLLLALILFGAGFALKILWWVAVVVLIVWVLGFVMRGTHSSGGRNRWYRW